MRTPANTSSPELACPRVRGSIENCRCGRRQEKGACAWVHRVWIAYRKDMGKVCLQFANGLLDGNARIKYPKCFIEISSWFLVKRHPLQAQKSSQVDSMIQWEVRIEVVE